MRKVVSSTDITAVPIEALICWVMFIRVEPRAIWASLRVRRAAVMVGIIVMPMPRPITKNAPDVTQNDVSVVSMVSGNMPMTISTSPVSTNLPGPNLSVSEPAIGIVSIAPRPIGAPRTPAISGVSPRTPMKYCGKSSIAPKNAIAKQAMVITAMLSSRLRKRCRSISGCSARVRAWCTKAAMRARPTTHETRTLADITVPAPGIEDTPYRKIARPGESRTKPRVSNDSDGCGESFGSTMKA